MKDKTIDIQIIQPVAEQLGFLSSYLNALRRNVHLILSAWFVVQYLLGWVRRSAGTPVDLRWSGYAVWAPNLRWSPILPSDGSPLVKIVSQM